MGARFSFADGCGEKTSKTMGSEEFLALHKLCMQIGSRLLDLERRVQRLEHELTKLQLVATHDIVREVMDEIAEDVEEEVETNG